MTVTLFDSHCHFDFEAFDADRSQVWEHCQSLRLTQLLVPGVSPSQWPRARDLSGQMPGLCWAAGLHPWWLNEIDGVDWESLLRDALGQTGCVALGECGLDKLIDTPLDEQEALLERQLELAQTLDLPVILHCVKADNELIRLLKRHSLPRGGVVHGFSGSRQMAETYWGMGFYLGIGGTITYERARKTREAAQSLPLEALLLETDAPDMPLQGHQGERNSPEYLLEVAQTLATLRATSLEEVARQTTENARYLFQVDQPRT